MPHQINKDQLLAVDTVSRADEMGRVPLVSVAGERRRRYFYRRSAISRSSARWRNVGDASVTVVTSNFLTAITSTSTRMHGEFLRLLFLQAHRETTAHFTALGMPAQQHCDSFRYRRAAFYNGLKSKVGLAAAKAAADPGGRNHS